MAVSEVFRRRRRGSFLVARSGARSQKPRARTSMNASRPGSSTTSRWKVGVNLLDRFLGKELCVLAWAAERATPEQCAVICTKWAALRPEERWWLFSTTAAEGGLAQDRERGWRKALYYALSDGDARLRPTKARRSAVRDAPELPLFDTKE